MCSFQAIGPVVHVHYYRSKPRETLHFQNGAPSPQVVQGIPRFCRLPLMLAGEKALSQQWHRSVTSLTWWCHVKLTSSRQGFHAITSIWGQDSFEGNFTIKFVSKPECCWYPWCDDVTSVQCHHVGDVALPPRSQRAPSHTCWHESRTWQPYFKVFQQIHVCCSLCLF